MNFKNIQDWYLLKIIKIKSEYFSGVVFYKRDYDEDDKKSDSLDKIILSTFKKSFSKATLELESIGINETVEEERYMKYFLKENSYTFYDKIEPITIIFYTTTDSNQSNSQYQKEITFYINTSFLESKLVDVIPENIFCRIDDNCKKLLGTIKSIRNLNITDD